MREFRTSCKDTKTGMEMVLSGATYATEHGLKPEQLLKLGAEMIIQKKPEMGEMSQEMVDAFK